MQFEAGTMGWTITVVEFVAAKASRFNRVSTPQKFLVLILKEFQEMRRVDHLVPNQVLGPELRAEWLQAALLDTP